MPEQTATQRDSLEPADLLATDQLVLRPRGVADHAAVNCAVGNLAREMLDRPERLLKRFVELSVELCRAGSAGVSLLETQSNGDVIFRWAALAGAFAPYEGGSTPKDFSPCGMCLERGEPILLSYPARIFTYFDQVPEPIVEGLVLPLYGVEREALGTIWIMAHDERRKFDRNDVESMQRLADFAALALEMSRRIEGQRRLTEELDHRVKNLLATVQSIIIQTQPDEPSSRAFSETVTARITAMARTHELLSKGQWRHVQLRDLLAAVAPTERVEVSIDGEDIVLQPRAAQALGMAFDELATNAAKHGALLLPGGRAHVGWRIVGQDGAGQLEIVWQESGGPPVQPPTRYGVGRSIIERGLPFELGGSASLEFRPTGLRCEIRLPLSRIAVSSR